MNDPTPPQTTPAAPTVPVPTSTSAPPDPHTKSGLSKTEAETMAGWIRQDLLAGKMTTEATTKAFDELGASPEQRLPVARSDAEKQTDQVFGVPAKSEEYLIPYGKPGEAVPMTEQIKAFDANVRGWMADAGLSRESDNGVVAIISKAIQFTHTMSPEQRETYKDQENEKLHQLFGGQDQLEEQLQPAATMIHELDQKRPGLREFVRAHGDNALFVAQLIQAARAYHARKRR